MFKLSNYSLKMQQKDFKLQKILNLFPKLPFLNSKLPKLGKLTLVKNQFAANSKFHELIIYPFPCGFTFQRTTNLQWNALWGLTFHTLCIFGTLRATGISHKGIPSVPTHEPITLKLVAPVFGVAREVNQSNEAKTMEVMTSLPFERKER